MQDFLHPLSVDELHGIGPPQAGRLKSYGPHTIGALAAMPEDVACRLLGGRHGRTPEDTGARDPPRTITARRTPESASAPTGFPWDETGATTARAAVRRSPSSSSISTVRAWAVAAFEAGRAEAARPSGPQRIPVAQ
ncbi:hypothetical protein ABZ618_00275 [Streptomyces roseolus]|uniref:hypothetical protein n=1 Tax=Streptomyces roseolus TaxID=67358 RepID=UPI0033D54AC8